MRVRRRDHRSGEARAGSVRHRPRQGVGRPVAVSPPDGGEETIDPSGLAGPGGRRLSGKRPSRLSESLPSESTAFAHASERQFAKLLDFYQIEWQYEPTSFDLERDPD